MSAGPPVVVGVGLSSICKEFTVLKNAVGNTVDCSAWPQPYLRRHIHHRPVLKQPREEGALVISQRIDEETKAQRV